MLVVLRRRKNGGQSMEFIADRIGDTGALFALGLLVGLVFGSAALS